MRNPSTQAAFSNRIRSCLRVGYTFTILYAVLLCAALLSGFESVVTRAEQISVTAQYLGLAVMILGIWGVMEPEERLPWKIILCSAICFVCAETAWMLHLLEYGEKPPTPSLCDAFYVMNSLLLLLGVIVYLYLSGGLNSIQISLDFVISLVASFGIIYFFVMQPVLKSSSGTVIMLIDVFYPVSDFCMLSGMLLIIFNRSIMPSRRDVLLGLSLLLSFAGDEIDLIATHYDLDLYAFSLPLWAVMVFTMALATLQPRHALYSHGSAWQVTDRQAEIPGRFRTLYVLRMMLPFLLTVFVLSLSMYKYHLFEPLFWWGMLLVVLLSLRQLLVLGQNRRLLYDLQRQDRQLKEQNHELQRLNAQVLREARVDFLTQLLNRRRIDELLERELSCGVNGTATGVLLIDVDFFKRINDTFGHQIGDEVLRGVALEISACLPRGSYAGRYGGDEFLAVLPGAAESQLQTAGETLVERVRGSATLRPYRVSLSVGGALNQKVNIGAQLTPPGAAPSAKYREGLLKHADEALYSAKLKGRDRFVLYRPDNAGGQS